MRTDQSDQGVEPVTVGTAGFSLPQAINLSKGSGQVVVIADDRLIHGSLHL
jgi:hypothetical protein